MYLLLEGMCTHQKVFPSPKGPLMLGFNKVFYCLKCYCLFELFIIPLDGSASVAWRKRDSITHVSPLFLIRIRTLHFVIQVGFSFSAQRLEAMR